MKRDMDSGTELDRSLVTAFLRRGDEGAFRQLYHRHTPSLYLLARRLLGGSSGAEDAIQDTWLRAAGRLGSFRWESSLRTWLCGITVNRCREMLRGPDRSHRNTPDEIAVPAAEERLDLERAISRLPEGSRCVLVLHDIEGNSHVEIAAMMGIDEGTSRSQLHKARRALRLVLRIKAPLEAEGVRDDS